MPDPVVPPVTISELPKPSTPVFQQSMYDNTKGPDMGFDKPLQNAQAMDKLLPSAEEYAKSVSYGPSITDLINQIDGYKETMQGMIDNFGIMSAGVSGTGFNPQKNYSNFLKSINPEESTMAAFNKPMVVGPESGYKRYAESEDYQALGYTPSIGDEQEYKYGRSMTWGDTIGKAFGGASRLAADTFVEGWKGWGRMADALVSWDSSKLMGTPEEQYEMAQRQEDIMNKYAIYDTAESKDGIFNRQFFGNMLQQSGFAVGAGLQFAAEELLTFGLASAFAPLTKGLALGRMIKTTEKVGDLVNDARKVMDTVTSSEKVTNAFASAARKIVPLYGTAEDMVKLGKAGAGTFQLAMTGLGGVRRSLSEFNMARSESMFESAGTYKQLSDKLTQEYKDKFGVAPTGAELEKIKQHAEDAAHDNFWTNVGVLSVMNRIQFDNMFKGFNTTRKIFNTEAANLEGKAFKVAGKIAGKEETRAFTTGMFGRLSAVGEISKTFGKKTAAWEATKSLGKGLMKWEGSEGLQELIQTASDEGLKNYYTDLYHGAKGYGTKMDNVMEELYKERPWASTEGLKTFLMGALTGRLISPLSMIQERTLGRSEYKDKKAQAKEAVANLNAFYSNPDNWLKESIANVKVQNKAAETMEEAAKNHNRYVFNNYRDSAFGKAVSSAIKLNMFESMRDTIKGYGETMTNDEFKQAFGVEATAENKKNVKNFMGEIVGQMEDYHTTYQNLKDKYGDKVLPELYKNNKPEEYLHMAIAKKAVDDAIETLTTNVHKAKQAVKRASALQTEIASNPNIGSSSIEVLTKMGSEKATQDHIEMLEREIKSTEDLAKETTLTPEARKILNDQKEELKFAKKWQQSYQDLLANTDESYSPSTEGRAYQAFVDMVNLFNKRANNNTTISKEDVDENFIKFNDYIRLNEDHKSYVDAMNLLADPTNLKLIAEASRSAITATQEEFKAEQEEELNKVAGEETKKEEAPKKSTIIKTVDKDGNPIEFEIVEGESYITESSPERRVYKGKYPTTVYNQDILKIVSINDDGSISFTYNNEGEAITMTAEEFAEIGKLYPLSKMSVPQRIYFRNRDLVFDLNVYKETGKPHYNKGKHANKDYSAGGINVKARFELVKEGDDYVLKVTYINPVTKLKESIDYDAAYLKKYASNKKDLFDITEAEQDVLNKRTEARRLTQIRMLTEAIANIVPNREKLLAERNKNEEDYEKIRKELEDYVAEMELIEERFKAKPYTKGRKSKERVELEARQEVLRNLIKNAENLIERFDAQATEIEKQLDSLNQLSEYYSEGVKELEESGQPYSMQEGKIYGAEEIKLKEAQGQQLIKRNIDNKTIDALVDDTQAELDLVNERITILQRIVDYSNKVLNRISKVTDLLDALENITDKKQLLNQLVLMKRQETDADNKQTIQNLINAVNKGDSLELAYIYEAMDRMNEAKEEIANLLEEASYLQDKYDRLSLAKQQRSNISALEYRLDMLKAIQEELLARYAAAQEKAGVKQEGAKVIVKNTAIPVEDDLIKGADALFTTQPISDVIPGSEEDKDPYIMMDAFMPILDGNALYKTAGRHFADLKDTTLASAQDARFFKFSETAKLSDENGVVYFLMPITKDSKDYQDLRFSGYADDIRLVVVKRDGAGGFKPVGMDGNILETPTKDNMIYIGMHGGPELMSDNPETVYSWLSENFAIFDKKTGKDRVSKEQALAIANSFKQAREAIKQKVKAGEKVILPIVDKSPGVYNREPLTGGYDENGNPVPQRPQEISLEGRLIEANPDFSNLKHPDGRPTKLEVSTTDSRVKAGRVMMTRLGEPGIVVYNRKFTEAEHQNIIDILKRVSELFIQKNTQEGLTEEQNTEFTTAVKYLQGITFWSPLKEGAEPYSFQLTVNNGLNIGKEVIPFTSDSIEQNKDKIKQALEYHKVNNRFLSDKLKDEPFYDVKAIDGKIIKGKQYLNYQHYLLADRPGGSILYTNMKEYVPASENKLEPQHYQLKNVYFKYDASSYITEPVQEPGDQGTVVDKDNIKQYSVQQTEKTANGVTLSILENNIPKEGKVTFVTTKSNKEELYLHTEYKNGKYEIFQIIDEKGNDLTNVQIQGKSAKEQYQSGFEIRSIDKQLENLSKNAEKTQELKVTQTEILDLFKETFIRIEDYAKQGEVMNDVKASEIVTASVVPTAPVTPTPVSNVNSLIDKRVIEDELTKGRYSFYPTEQAAKENKGVVITKDNVNQAIETENKLGDVIYDNKSNKITGIPTPEIKVSISSGTSIVFENAKDLEEFINNPKNNAQERVKAKAEYDRLASIQSTTPTQTSIERQKGESVKDFITKLFTNKYLTDVDGKQIFILTHGRFGIVVNINGIKIPFYQSTSGTDTKVKGNWYPFFGDLGNWVIKGNSDDSNVGYGFKAIQDIQNFLNANIKENDAIALSGLIPSDIVKDQESFRNLDEALLKAGTNVSTNKRKTADRLGSILGYTYDEAHATKSDKELFDLATKKLFAQLSSLQTKPTQTAPVAKPPVTSVSKTYDDYVNDKYKRHVTETKSNGGTPLSRQEFADKFSKQLETQYKLDTQKSIDQIVKDARDAAAQDDGGYDANTRVAEAIVSAKLEDVDKFKEWLNKVLPQIPLNIVDELIDGKYFGQFLNGTINMYKLAEEGTGFHEAFEAVWNSYLSAEKQLDLIDEYKNRPDYKSLPSYKWAEARYKTKNENIIIKEALAEEFREYMLTDAATVKPQSPKRNTFFRKIWNFIKKLLGLSKDQRVEMESKANELFSDIGKGKFKNIEPVQKFDPSAAHNRAAISGTSVEFTQQLMEGMTAIFFSKLSSQAYRSKGYSIEKMFDENNNIFETVFKDTWSTVYNRFVPGLNKVMESDAFIYSDTDKQNQIIANYVKSIEEQDAKINSDLFEQKKRAINKDVYNTEVRKQFKDYLSQFGLKFKQVEDNTKSEEEIAEIEGKEEQANALGIRDVIYIDPTSLTNPTVRLLILSLPNNKQDESGNVTDVRNKLNLPSLVSYKRKMNILLNELSDTVPMMREQPDGTFKKTSALEEMFTNLDKKFKDPIYKARYKDGYEWVGKLKSRLKFDVLVNGGILSNDEMKLIVAFETSFTRNKNNPLKVLVGADGKVRHVNSVSVNTTEKIKEEWKNNIKETAYKVDISKLDTGGILYINPDNRIEVNLSSPRVKFILGASDVRGHLAAFNALGITLSTTAEKLSEVDKNTIKKAYNGLKYVMEERIKTNTSLNYDDLFDSKLVAGPLNSLLALELNYRSEDTLLSHQTAEGKTQYAITLPSEISYVVDSLNSANSLQEFIMSNPQYGKVVNGVVTLNPYNASSEILTPGGLIFDNKGRKRENAKIEYEYISGMASDKENGGDNTDSLNFNDKIVQEIYHLLRGSYFTVINSDKSSEFAVKMGHFVKMRDIADMNFIEDKYVAALRGEVMHALRFHFFPNNIKYHQKNILMLGHFSGILGFVKEGKQNALQQYFNKLVKDTKISKKTKPEDANLIFETLADNFAGVVKNQGVIKDYVSTQVDDVKTWLLNKEIVKPTEIESLGGSTISRLKALGIPKDSEALGTIDPTRMTEVEFTQLIRFLTVNRQLGVFEQHKLFYGHPAMYKDLAKRANGANSQKNVVSENPHIISWLEQNKPRYDGRKRDAQNPFVRNISYADPIATSVHTKYIAEELYKGISKTVSKAKAEDLIGAKFDDNGNLVSIQGGEGKYLSGYINMKEADAQAGIMPDYFRDLMYLSGSLSNEQEALLDWENASEIIDRSKKNHPYYNPKYTAKQIADAQVILDKGRPTAILQVLKPQGFGFQNTDGMSHIDYLKNSVLPLTWSRVKNNPDMLSKYINAQNNGVDIIGFDSGHKVGVVTNSKGALTPFYNQDGTISTETPVLQDIFSKYVGIQVQTPDYAKNKVIFGSQVRKLILSDLPESLKPYAQEYRDVLNKLLDIEKTDLIKELGLKPKSDGSYEIENAGKLMEMLRQEAIKRNLPDNIVEMLGTFMDDNKEVPKYPLDANPARERIESVLNSIVDNRIIRTEMFGKANVQVASAFFSQGRKLLYIKDGKYEKVDDFSKLSDAEKKTTVLASTDLNFYNKEKPYMEVYTPWYFKGISPEEAGFVQNKEGMWIAPEGSDVTKLLNSIGFRIPTQGLNSIDSIVIKGFLDPSYGDMVVVPSEMVGKSGSDFDIDKLNMFLANYHVEIEKLSFEELGEFKSFYSYDNLPKYIREWFGGLSKEQADDFIDDLNKFSVTSGMGEFGNLSTWLKQNNITGQQAEIYESFKNALVEYNQYKRDLINRNKVEAGKVKAKKLVYIDPATNTGKKGLQNRVLEIMKTIVEHPDNQRQLLTPNSSAKLKALSLEILKLKGIVKVDDDMTKLSEWKTMSETRETFVTSKQLVGIGALQVTSHAMSQIGEVELTGKYVDFDGTERDVVIKLPNSNTNKLNLTIDDDGMFIFDLFNEALTGSVDAARDPFIFDIRLNLDTASTWFYLTKRGVSQENIALMFNQPVMDDYFKYRDANDTYVNEVNDEKDYFNNIIIKAAAQYYTEATGKVIGNGYLESQKALASFRAIQDQFKNYSTKDLKSAISSKGLTKQQNLMQVAILMDMLDYREQANKLSNFVRGISYDTNKTKNIVENYLQRARYNIAVNDNFVTRDSIDRVFNNTFLGKIKETKEDVLKMFENFFIVLNPKSLKAFEPILEKLDDDKLFMTNDAKADMLNRYQNFFITHVLQNTTFGNNEKLSQYYNLFTDGKNESLAKRLKKMKAKYPESIALKNFYPLINQNRNSPDGIKMFNNKMSPYEINAISESIDILHTQAEMTGDVELKEFIDNLARFAILQSGVQLSPITFTKVLPIDLYAGLTADIFKNFTKDNNDVDVDQIWKAFHQNNWKNNKIVPTLKANPKKRAVMKADGDGLLKLDRGDRMVKNKYFKMYTKKEGVALEFDVTLYERVKVTDATGKDITLEKSAVKYRPINKLGNGMYVMETTPDLLTNASRFDINGDVAENSFDPAVKTWKELLSTAELVGDRPEFDKLPGKSATPTMTYAGIGSRETPQRILDEMTAVAKELSDRYTLNTGKTYTATKKYLGEEEYNKRAQESQRLSNLHGNKVGLDEEGADRAFSAGTNKKNLFSPNDTIGNREMKVGEEIHPSWNSLSDGAKKLMARNTNQIFGSNLDTPVDFVLFYAEDTGKKGKTGENRPEGGTGQAVEMARAKGIPTINMQDTDWKEQLKRVLDAKPVETSADVKRLNGIKEFIKLRFGNLQGTELVDAMLEDKKEMFEDTVKLFMKLNPNMSKEEIDKGIEEIKNTYNYISVQATTGTSTQVDTVITQMEQNSKQCNQ